MHTKAKVLLAAAAAALALAGIAGAASPPSAQYPWVQPPASVGIGQHGVLPSASATGAQLPAWLPAVPIVHRPAIAGSSYRWVQPWVGRTHAGAPRPTASQPWVQPPAWIPIG